MIAYGVFRKVSSIDPQKTYDYHMAFDIKPTEVHAVGKESDRNS